MDQLFPTFGKHAPLVLDLYSSIQIYQLLVISVFAVVRLGYCTTSIPLLVCLLFLSIFTFVTCQNILGIMSCPGHITMVMKPILVYSLITWGCMQLMGFSCIFDPIVFLSPLLIIQYALLKI